MDWSSDGTTILFYEITPETQRDLWTVAVDRDGRPAGSAKPYLRTPFNEWHARFSPEPSPHWVAYESDESGRPEVYIQSFPEPKGARRISTAGGSDPAWGKGGKELFYVAPDFQLMQVELKAAGDSLEPSVPKPLFALSDVNEGVMPYAVSADGEKFLVRTPQDLAPQPLHVIVNWPALLKHSANEH